MKHASISIFVPHLACPNNCIFCNQRKISGVQEPQQNIRETLKKAVAALPDKFTQVDIAFFGGSFTGIEETLMRSYLSAAAQIRRESDRVTGIRISTRPDYINEPILNILEEYGVTAVELGAQSMRDDILQKAGRGHTAQQIIQATRLLQKRNFETVLQFMPGLPGDTDETILDTASKIAALSPDGVRIYPCVVIHQTELYELYKRGEYTPLQTEHAVELCAEMVPMFRKKNIQILRIGLHSCDLVQTQSVAAGPFHPAFGELVRQRIYLNTAIKSMRLRRPSTDEILWVGKGYASQMTGNKRKNILILQEMFDRRFIVKEKQLQEFEIERDML